MYNGECIESSPTLFMFVIKQDSLKLISSELAEAVHAFSSRSVVALIRSGIVCGKPSS